MKLTTMKRIFLISALAVLAFANTGCNVFKQVQAVNIVSQAQDYLDKHCPKTTVADPLTGNIHVHYECDSLWNSGALKQHCSSVSFCIEAVSGKISGDITCDSVYALPKLSLSKPHP